MATNLNPSTQHPNTFRLWDVFNQAKKFPGTYISLIERDAAGASEVLRLWAHAEGFRVDDVHHEAQANCPAFDVVKVHLPNRSDITVHINGL